MTVVEEGKTLLLSKFWWQGADRIRNTGTVIGVLSYK